MRDYDHGPRDPQALDELRDVETDSLQWRERERVRYALYRGLPPALGDRAATWHWLDEAHRASLQNPRLASDADTGRLSSALSHLATESP